MIGFGFSFVCVSANFRLLACFYSHTRIFLTCFPPTVEAVFGKDSSSGSIWLMSWKSFYGFWFFAMAITNVCPVWSFTGFLVKYGFVPNISGKLTPKLCENIDKRGYYCLTSEDKTKIVAIRYGLCGPLIPTLSCAQSQGAENWINEHTRNQTKELGKDAPAVRDILIKFF